MNFRFCVEKCKLCFPFYFSNDIQILDRVVSVAIKAEFHTNRNIKIKDGGNKNNGEYDSNQNGSNEEESNFNEVKELNFQEKARLHELYDASRSLSCPLEQDKDVSTMSILRFIYLETLQLYHVDIYHYSHCFLCFI